MIATWAASIAASPYDDLRDVPQSPVIVDRPLFLHIGEVNDLARSFVDLAVSLDLPIDRDVTLAAAILHDVDKPLIYRRSALGEFAYEPGTTLKDHGRLGADLALAHGVPPTIAEMVRIHSQFASTGLPETPEGTALHYADALANDMAAVQFGSADHPPRLPPRAAREPVSYSPDASRARGPNRPDHDAYSAA